MAQGQSVDSQLSNRLLSSGPWFKVQNINGAAPDLHQINVAGDGFSRFKGQRNLEERLALKIAEVSPSQNHRRFHGHRRAIIGEHKFLEPGVAELVSAYRLKHQAGVFRGAVIDPGRDFDLVEVEDAF